MTSQYHRRSRVWRVTIDRVMLQHHRRYLVWFPNIGPDKARSYRLWIGSRWAGTRELMRRDRQKAGQP